MLNIWKGTPHFLISACILLPSFSLNFWMEHRLIISGFPVSIPDIFVMYYAFYWAVKFVQDGSIRLGGKIGLLILLWFLYNLLFCSAKGFVEGNSIYAILQEFRIVGYATIGYFATLRIFRAKKHLPVVMISLIGSGLIVSIWQIGITVLGRGQSLNESVFMMGGAVARTLRDVTLPTYFASSALVVLFALKKHAFFILGKARRWAWAFNILFLTASILSMTRTVWLSLGLSLFFIFIYSFWTAFHSARFKNVFLLLIGSIAAGTLGYVALLLFLPSTISAIELMIRYSDFYNDPSLLGRLNQPLALLDYLHVNGSLWTGIGFGNMWSGAKRIGIFSDIHNVYYSYLLIGGILGLLIFLSIWISLMFVYIRLLLCPLNGITKAYCIFCIINWAVMTVLMYGMPPHWSEAALLGMTLAISTVLAANSKNFLDEGKVPSQGRKLHLRKVNVVSTPHV